MVCVEKDFTILHRSRPELSISLFFLFFIFSKLDGFTLPQILDTCPAGSVHRAVRRYRCRAFPPGPLALLQPGLLGEATPHRPRRESQRGSAPPCVPLFPRHPGCPKLLVHGLISLHTWLQAPNARDVDPCLLGLPCNVWRTLSECLQDPDIGSMPAFNGSPSAGRVISRFTESADRFLLFLCKWALSPPMPLSVNLPSYDGTSSFMPAQLFKISGTTGALPHKYTNAKTNCVIWRLSKNLWRATISNTIGCLTGLAALINEQGIFFYISLKRNKQTGAFVASSTPPSPRF